MTEWSNISCDTTSITRWSFIQWLRGLTPCFFTSQSPTIYLQTVGAYSSTTFKYSVFIDPHFYAYNGKIVPLRKYSYSDDRSYCSAGSGSLMVQNIPRQFPQAHAIDTD
ncbi:MAG: hypothetical protein ACTSVC_06715 [Promethearchaeota archaeon]